ncbi:MAG: helix-turn-helix domain-containing protein, partial [Eubacteriales bacterium]|nr:helix-turn-helix domain-containing protein [Eubacteriales bacterium]
MSFGENLQYYRSEGGLTQEQLAERLEVSRQSVSKWESDASFPEMDKLLVMCA